MFRRVWKLSHACRERVLSLALLPAFLFGTLPHSACICADGHREQFCKTAACRSIADGSNPAACCGCTCCRDRGSELSGTCCQGKSRSDTQPADGLAATTNDCCHPIVESPSPAAAPSKAELAMESTMVATVEPLVSFAFAKGVQLARHWSDSAKPPPPDLVILFLHLTI